MIVVTKCNMSLSVEEKEKIIEEIRPASHQKIFFTGIEYSAPYHIVSREKRNVDESTEVLLVTGIANPRPLKKYLSDHSSAYDEILYSDHHIFSIDDWKEIRKRFEAIQSPNKIILTTEKDAMRLMKFHQSLADYPFFVIPMQVAFLFDGDSRFSDFIATFITGFPHQKE